MGLSGSGINEENHIVSGSWIAWLIDDSIGTILFVPFCPYHFVPYNFVLEPQITPHKLHSVILAEYRNHPSKKVTSTKVNEWNNEWLNEWFN